MTTIHGQIKWDGAAIRALNAEIGRQEAVDHRPHFLYRAYDANGTLLYIGCTRDPWLRTDAHRRTSPWFSSTVRISWESVGGLNAARAAERRAIQTERPLHNVQYGTAPRKPYTRRQLRAQVPA